MNLQLLNNAEIYYQLNGFKKIEAPWTVKKEISDLTKPPQRRDFLLEGEVLVGSAEQSFLDLYFSNRLQDGRYVSTTPCFRDEEVLDDLHRQYFLKTELIQIGNVNLRSLQEIITIALGFFSQFIPVDVIKLDEESFDIYSKKSHIELGSYGIRRFSLNGQKIEYIFATGCAVPRLSSVIKKEKKIGYHQDLAIPKTSVGSILKVFEEVHELQDAVLQKQKVLALCELADLVGAIDLYLKENKTNLSLHDLQKMSRLTRRAFKVGSR
jgi:hypothetical protein